MLITEQYATAPQQPAQPTFNWTGVGTPVGSRVHYSSFNFAGEPYALGNAVYLLPEEEGAPPYIARLVGAWEDTAAPEPERLVIEVQWFERRCAVPAGLAAVMHEREVAESDLRDTNQVGCIDRKALLVAAPSYSEALAQIPTSRRKGEWHFCRGVLESETQIFRTYAELGQHMGPYDQAGGLMCELGLAAGDAAGSAHPHVAAAAAAAAQHMGNGGLLMDEEDEEMDEPPPAPAARKGGGKGSGGAARNRRGGAAARGSAAGGAGGGVAGRGIPGKICCECGATQTPQWREGPQGPKTLCNACGVRYQRSQSKAKSNKRAAREQQQQHGGGGGRGPKAARFNHNSSAAAADGVAGLSNGASSVAAGDGSSHPHGTRSKGGSRQQQQQQRTYVIHRGSQQQQQQPQQPPPRQPGKGRPPSGSKQQQALLQQLHAQAAAAAAAAAAGRAEQHHYFEDEGSPPNSNTHILEVDDEETAQPQLKDTLHRSATQDAADVLQTLSTASHQQQLPRPQQQQQQLLHHRQRQDLLLQQQSTAAAAAAATAAFCNSSVIGSPATMLLPDQLTADGMPLLSLDDKITPVVNRPGSPDGLIGINTNSLSPIQPRNQRGAAAGGGSSGARGLLGVDAAAGGSGGRQGIAPSAAACASPGRLISSMLQGLKMPGPLSLNGTPPMPPLPPVTSALSAADRQQQQLLPGIGGSDAGRFGGQPPALAAAAAAAGGGSAAGAASGGNNPLLSQLQSLVYRASAFTSDLQGLGALYPGPGSPTDLPALVRQLEQLPHGARSEIQRASTDVEDSISRAKAAEAAVLAVTQVLAAKKQAAAEARCEVEKAVLTFRHMLAQFSPSVAAAVAAGSGGGAGGSGGAGGTGAGSLASPAGSGGDAGGAAAGSAGGVVGGSSRLGGNSPRVLMPHAQAALSHHTGFEGVDCFGPHQMTHPGGLVMADASVTDDLLRDPYAADDAAAAGAAAGAAAAAADASSGAAQAAAVAPADQNQQQPKLEHQQAKPEQHQGPSSPDHSHQQQQDQQKQQQVATKQEAPQQDQQQSLLKQEAGEQQQPQLALCSGSLLQQPAKHGHSAAAAPAAAVAQVSAPPPSAAHTASGTAQVAA